MSDSSKTSAASESEKKSESVVAENKGGEPDKSDTVAKKDASAPKIPVCVLIPCSLSTNLFSKFGGVHYY